MAQHGARKPHNKLREVLDAWVPVCVWRGADVLLVLTLHVSSFVPPGPVGAVYRVPATV